jgi:hypothetical protein
MSYSLFPGLTGESRQKMKEKLKTLDSRFRGNNDKDIIEQSKAIGHYFYMLQ